jgi:hypothetical protein
MTRWALSTGVVALALQARGRGFNSHSVHLKTIHYIPTGGNTSSLFASPDVKEDLSIALIV